MHDEAALRFAELSASRETRPEAKALAVKYVEANHTDIEARMLAGVVALRQKRLHAAPTVEELVALVDEYREQNDEASRALVDMWIMATRAPRVISGRFDLRRSLVGAAASGSSLGRGG